jgi:hypothetical protein
MDQCKVQLISVPLSWTLGTVELQPIVMYMCNSHKFAPPQVGKSHVKKGVLVLQVNLEFLTVDRRTFVTDEDKSLQVLFGDSGDAASATQGEVQTIARRLVTLFASLKVCWGWEMQWLRKYLALGCAHLSLGGNYE